MIQVIKTFLGYTSNVYFPFGGSFTIFRYARRRIEVREILKNAVDKGIYVVCFASPISSIPQIWQVFMAKNTEGLSLFTWSAYLFLTFFWLAYGYIHKDTPIIISQILWVLIYGFGTVGIVLYSK